MCWGLLLPASLNSSLPVFCTGVLFADLPTSSVNNSLCNTDSYTHVLTFYVLTSYLFMNPVFSPTTSWLIIPWLP